MPISKQRPPDRYPARFHAILAKGLGDHRMGLEQATGEAADREMRRFMYFRRDLLRYPMHKTTKFLQKYIDAGWTVRAKIILTHTGWDVEVRIRKPKVVWPSPDMEIFNQLEKSLGGKLAAGG